MDRSGLRDMIFKAVFQFAFSDTQEFPERLQRFFDVSADVEPSAGDMAYVREKTERIREALPRLDEAVSRHTKGWRIERLNKVDLAILRVGLYEALMDDDIPVNVAVSEAVLLAKRYSSPKSASFINGILGQITKEEGKAGESVQ